jgi:hypothetical protein
MDAILNDGGFEPTSGGGIFRQPSGMVVGRPLIQADRRLVVHGFVAKIESDNSSQSNTRLTVNASDTSTWQRVLIQDSMDNLYPFVFPQSAAMRLCNYSIVTVRGRCIRHDGELLLIATEVTSHSYPSASSKKMKIARFGKIPACHYCDRKLGRARWGLNDDFRLECETCGSLRGSLSPQQFLRHVRKIARCRLKMS